MRFFLMMVRSRYFLWAILSLPFLYITVSYSQGNLFYGEVIHLSGEISARLLIIVLSATPLQLMFPGKVFARWLIKHRRYLGVACFAYAALHTVVYLYKVRSWPGILDDAQRPEFWTGWASLFIFLVLAMTSNDRSVRWLKRKWKSLHRYVYAAAVLLFVHWVLIAFNRGPAIAHLTLLAAIEGYRFWKTSRFAAPQSEARGL